MFVVIRKEQVQQDVPQLRRAAKFFPVCFRQIVKQRARAHMIRKERRAFVCGFLRHGYIPRSPPRAGGRRRRRPPISFDPASADLAIDALFGAGLARDLDGVTRDCVARINDFAASGRPVLAVDVPSGVDARPAPSAAPRCARAPA